jgi:hypothetical protein
LERVVDGLVADRFQAGWSEFAEDVVGAAGEFAGNRERRAGVGEPVGLERAVVGVVGAGWAAGGLGGFIERPAQLGGALPQIERDLRKLARRLARCDGALADSPKRQELYPEVVAAPG